MRTDAQGHYETIDLSILLVQLAAPIDDARVLDAGSTNVSLLWDPQDFRPKIV